MTGIGHGPNLTGNDAKRKVITGLLMLRFFVRNLSLSAQDDGDGFIERALSRN